MFHGDAGDPIPPICPVRVLFRLRSFRFKTCEWVNVSWGAGSGESKSYIGNHQNAQVWNQLWASNQLPNNSENILFWHFCCPTKIHFWKKCELVESGKMGLFFDQTEVLCLLSKGILTPSPPQPFVQHRIFDPRIWFLVAEYCYLFWTDNMAFSEIDI